MGSLDARVAYFTAEIGLSPAIPTYSGGLGVLSGDTAKSAADLGLPVVFVSLMYHNGYFEQVLDGSGWQGERPSKWNPENEGLKLLPNRVEVTVSGRPVKVQAWEKTVSGRNGEVKVYFLDANVEGNTGWDRGLTFNLYDSGGNDGKYYRLCQEIILGMGGVKMLRDIGYGSIGTFHMNDGHSALLTYELLKETGFDDGRVRELCWFTTHTPVAAGFDYIPADKAVAALGGDVWHQLRRYAEHNGSLSTAHLATRLSRGVNAVSMRHAEVCSRMDIFSGLTVMGITNGVHHHWVSDSMAAVYDEYMGSWRDNPALFRQAGKIPFGAIREAKHIDSALLASLIKEKTGVDFDPDIPIIGFARRAEEYKRGDLLFYDRGRLRSIVDGKLQLAFAGKAHPANERGKRLIQNVWAECNELNRNGINAVFLPDYSLQTARVLIGGSIIWLNTPLRDEEASGTSGMKVSIGAGVNMSVLSGWWAEAYDGANGWAIAPSNLGNDRRTDAHAIYELLERGVIPTLQEPALLDAMVKESVKLASRFNTHRMALEYARGPWGLAGIRTLITLEELLAA
ncbi:alpha-glucan family phosphorylase [Candidatus Woesearchaeota archaeon]|nr:alpha-glucan family phosphorylase [Candidatus Woesearchaeota archaeon]